jgi:hypothetical protein
MAALKHRLDVYDNVIGSDVKIAPLGDLALDPLDSDLSVLSGSEALGAAVRRRLSTPLTGYGRIVKTARGYEYVDADYGSTLSNFLSAPITDLALDDVVEVVQQDASKDPRLAQTAAAITEVNQNGYAIQLYYLPKTVDELIAQGLTVGNYAENTVFSAQVATNYSLLLPLY